MRSLCVDIGNTAIKVAVFEGEQLVHVEVLDIVSSQNSKGNQDDGVAGFVEASEVLSYLQKLAEAHHVHYLIMVDVRGQMKAGLQAKDFPQSVEKILVLTHTTSTPLTNCYASPETLGMDRMAVAVGAQHLFPNQDLLVIDMGTAITYEYVMADGRYLGGNISPGLQTRFRALHEFTGKLPLLKPASYSETPGRNTHDAIVNGVMMGIYHEMNAYATSFLSKKDGKILLTGGDINHFDMSLKSSIFVEPNLLFIGLNRILILNV